MPCMRKDTCPHCEKDIFISIEKKDYLEKEVAKRTKVMRDLLVVARKENAKLKSRFKTDS